NSPASNTAGMHQRTGLRLPADSQIVLSASQHLLLFRLRSVATKQPRQAQSAPLSRPPHTAAATVPALLPTTASTRCPGTPNLSRTSPRFLRPSGPPRPAAETPLRPSRH